MKKKTGGTKRREERPPRESQDLRPQPEVEITEVARVKNQEREEDKNLTISILEINSTRKGQEVPQNLVQEEAAKPTKLNHIRVLSQAKICCQRLREVFKRLTTIGTNNQPRVF